MLNDFFISRDALAFLEHFLDAEQLVLPDFAASLNALRERGQVTYAQWWQLLEALQQQVPRPALGLAIGARTRLQDCGLIGYLFQTSGNCLEALTCFQRFERLMYAGSEATLESADGGLALVWNPAFGYSSQLSDAFLLSAMLTVCRQILAEPGLPARQVAFTQPVAAEEERLYEAFFGCPVAYGQPRLSFALPEEALRRPFPKRDDLLHRLLGQQAEAVMASLPGRDLFLSQVREALVRCLHDGQPQAAVVARRLGLSSRTLHRRLGERGLLFREVLRDLRQSLSQRYLRDPALTLVDVALLLGYSEQSAFNRAFVEWFGVPPGQWRDGFRLRSP